MFLVQLDGGFESMLANVITATRIAASAAMLTCGPTDSAFWFLYAWCGISDIVDGPIARRLGEESALGARLDSAADLIFAVSCCLSLLPECGLAAWLITAIAVLTIVKVLFYALAGGKVRDVHSKENKVAGLVAFVTLPALFLTSLSVAALPACILAGYSIFQEGRAVFAR